MIDRYYDRKHTLRDFIIFKFWVFNHSPSIIHRKSITTRNIMNLRIHCCLMIFLLGYLLENLQTVEAVVNPAAVIKAGASLVALVGIISDTINQFNRVRNKQEDVYVPNKLDDTEDFTVQWVSYYFFEMNLNNIYHNFRKKSIT